MKKFTFLFALLLVCLGVFAQPVNDACNSATPIILPSSGTACATGTLTGATDDGSFTTCEVAGSNEVWYTYVTSGANNVITVTPNGATPASNLVVSVTSANCATGNINNCNAAATANGTATVSWAYPVGTQVWVIISSTTNSGGGFQVCVSSSTAPPSTGKDCSTAATICTQNSFNAPVSAGSNGFFPPCFGAAFQKPIIFKFSVGQSGLLNWRAQPVCAPPNANNTEFDWAVYDITNGCPGTQVACNYNYTGDPGFPPFIPPIAPTTTAQGMQGGPAAGCTSQGVNNTAGEVCQGVTVTAGNTYVIMIDQYSSNSNCSINFDFNGSTFRMAPTAAFTVTPSTGCGPVTVNFANTSTAATTYSWNFGDGTTSNVQNPPSKTYSTVGTYLIGLTTTSASGCTDVTSKSVQVFSVPVVTAVGDTICGGGATATLSATSTTPGGTYTWNPGNIAGATASVSPGASTTYTVTYTSQDNCTATATARVIVGGVITAANAGPDITICGNQSVSLSGSATPAGNYTYAWGPSATLQNANTATPTASPTQTTTYTLTATDAGGCSLTDAVTVTVNGTGIPTNATADKSIVCPGDQVQLAVSVKPVSCGASPTCPGGALSSQIGPGLTPQPGGGTTPPTLFGNFVKGYRNQMLYTAAELTAALGGACVIKGCAFNIATGNSSNQLQNFTIKMACTSATSLSTWEQNLTTVYSVAFFNPVYNVQYANAFNFQTGYAWDGVSNIIVDVCWFNPLTFGSQNNKAECTNTPFPSYLYIQGNTDQCGTTAAPTVYTLRPNIKFNTCLPDLSNYNIVWTPSQGTVSNPAIDSPTANPTVTTNYNVTVTNPSGTCPGTDVVTVQVDNSTISAGADKNSCPGAPVTLTATLSGTILPGPASYVWTTLAGANVGNTASVTVSPSTTTTYVVTLNGGACVKRDTVTVNIGALTPTATPTNLTCFGINTGSVLAASPTGTSPFNYTWSANAATGNQATASNLAPGQYQVTVTDATGCTGSATATVTQPTQLTLTTTPTNVRCFNGADGSITANPAGGTGNYSYQWSNGPSTNQTISGLTAGNYAVTVRDANQCSATAGVVISQPSAVIFFAPVVRDVRCFNGNTGSISVTNNGGTGVFTYTWSHNANLNNSTATNLTAGVYTVTASDANQCSASLSVTVSQPASGLTFNASNITSPTCFGFSNGSATVNPTGGVGTLDYLWTPSNQTTQTATNLTAQIYTVLVTDDSACTATTTVTVLQPAQIQITGVTTDVNCFGGADGAVDISIANGSLPFTYSWTDGSTAQDISGLAANTYTVTVTDNNTCTSISTFTVNEPAELLLSSFNVTDVSCFGQSTGAVNVVHTGGIGPYTFTWSPAGPNSGNNTGLIAGNYTLTVTDSHNCSVSGSYTVNQPVAALSFSNAVITNVLCGGVASGSITVSVSGGTTPAYTYSWSHNANLNNATASNLAAGPYTVTVTDANGCTLSQTNTVTEPAPITFTAPADVTAVSCFGGSDGSAEVFPTGGTGGPNYTYTWNNIPGNNPQGNLAAATYTVVVADVNNCTASTTAVVGQPDQLMVVDSAYDAFCFNSPTGRVDAIVTGGTLGYTYIWSPNGETTSTISGVFAGLYQVTVTDSKGCTASAAANVNQPSALTLNITAGDVTQVKCPGDKNGTISPKPSGGTQPYNYSATQDGANFFNPDPDNVIRGLASGYYAVIANDAQGCTVVDTAFVPAPLSDSYRVEADSTSCYGDNYNDGGLHIFGNTIQNGPFSFGVDGGPMQFSGDFYNLKAGNHTILAVNSFGCDTTLQAVVPSPGEAFAEILPADTTLDLGENIQLSNNFSPYPLSAITAYSWTPAMGLSCIDCPNPVATPYAKQTQYTLTITYNKGCTVSATTNILVEGGKPVYIPNSFSPNGDGNNDLFQIYGVGIKVVNLKVFNRWGELVYQTNNQFSGWDGTFRGVMQNPGVFVYEADITYLNDKSDKVVGSITLIR